MTHRMSPEGRALLRRLEGVRRERYLDEGGLPTIGVGHLIVAGETFDEPLTEAQVDALLVSDLARFEAAVNTLAKVPLTQHQFDALVSFAFNVGVDAFRRSTLLVKLLLGQYEAVPGELRKWVRVKGKVSPGLQKRREREIEWWLTADAPALTPTGMTPDQQRRVTEDLDKAFGLMTPASGQCGGDDA